MVNDNRNELDKLMQARPVPEPSHNLSERIIGASQKQKSSAAWKSIFVVPKPVMAIACVLLLGLFVLPSLFDGAIPQLETYSAQEDFASVLEDDFIYEAFDIS